MEMYIHPQPTAGTAGVRRVAITAELLAKALLLPLGAKIVGASYDADRDRLTLTVCSPDFPPAPHDKPVPMAYPEYGCRIVELPEFRSWGI